ncbi:MAG: CinA family protein [Spirochaetaceae bacterium]|nr:MAG: CinA family protein [Spirochaetaceae bacterium]
MSIRSTSLPRLSNAFGKPLATDTVDVGALARRLFDALESRGATVAVAESCTGGMLGAALTDLAGSSAFFVGGVIAYSNAAKQAVLGVARATIDGAGAVSEQCVLEMAAAVRQRFGADVGIAVSGIAGPGGGTDAKPVGTVWVAVATNDRSAAEHRVHPGRRSEVRERAVVQALTLALEYASG